MAELDERVEEFDRQDLGWRIGGRVRTVGEYFVIEAPMLAALLPSNGSRPGAVSDSAGRQVRADQGPRIVMYSVPVRLIGCQVRVPLHANDLEVSTSGSWCRTARAVSAPRARGG